MSPYRRLFLVVVLLVLSLIPSAAPLRAADSSADSSMVTVSPKVRKDITSDRVRVLVKLRLPGRGHVPEGRLTNARLPLSSAPTSQSSAAMCWEG